MTRRSEAQAGPICSIKYRKSCNNRAMCCVIGLASSGKVWRFFAFVCVLEGLSSSFFVVFFVPFPK